MINPVLNSRTVITPDDAVFIWGDEIKNVTDWQKMEFCSPEQLEAFKELMREAGMDISQLQTLDSRQNYVYNPTHQLVYQRQLGPQMTSLNGVVVDALTGVEHPIYINVGIMINRKRIYEKSNMLGGFDDANFGDNLGFWQGPNDPMASLVWTKEGKNK